MNQTPKTIKKHFSPDGSYDSKGFYTKQCTKEKRGISMPDGTSCFDNRHLMFSYSSTDQLINSNEAWTASEIFKRSSHWSTASSGNEKIFNNDRGECARINLEKCGQLQLIEYITARYNVCDKEIFRSSGNDWVYPDTYGRGQASHCDEVIVWFQQYALYWEYFTT